MPSAKVTSKGQITLPKAIRDLLRLDAGGRVDFVVQDDGTVVLRPATVDVRELKRPAPPKGHQALVRRDDERGHSPAHGGARVIGLDTNVLGGVLPPA
jgi:AbrB family looped-hinge helix DNA binding protein